MFALPLSTDYSAQQPRVASGRSSGWHSFGQTALRGNFKSSWTVELTDNYILVQKRKMEIYTDFFMICISMNFFEDFSPIKALKWLQMEKGEEKRHVLRGLKKKI